MKLVFKICLLNFLICGWVLHIGFAQENDAPATTGDTENPPSDTGTSPNNGPKSGTKKPPTSESSSPTEAEQPEVPVDEFANPVEPTGDDNPPETEEMVPPGAEGDGGGVGIGSGVPQAEIDSEQDRVEAEAPAAEPVAPGAALNRQTVESILERRHQDDLKARKDRVFGSYRLQIGAIKPYFEEEDTYKTVYGDTALMPTFAVDYFFYDWYATLGLTFRLSYYRDNGNALIKTADGNEQDPNGKVELTLVPVEIGGVMEMTPFSAKWIVLSGSFGFEWTYFQESRVTNTNASDSEDDDSSEDEEEDTDDDSGIFVTSGWRKATVVVGAVNLKLDALDEKASQSLNTMGLRSIFLSPFIQIATDYDEQKFNFARKAYGIAFTFETLR